jgi:hypothetical protein
MSCTAWSSGGELGCGLDAATEQQLGYPDGARVEHGFDGSGGDGAGAVLQRRLEVEERNSGSEGWMDAG